MNILLAFQVCVFFKLLCEQYIRAWGWIGGHAQNIKDILIALLKCDRYIPMKLLTVLLVCVIASGCSFRPMYGQGGQAELHGELSGIKVQHVPGKEGQRFGELVENRLGSTGDGRYELLLSVKRTEIPVILDRNRGISRYNMVVESTFKLVNAADKAVITSGRSSVISGYNVADSLYSTMIAGENASKQAFEGVADDIVRKLQIHFSSQK